MKIFLASSVHEFAEERLILKVFVSRLEDALWDYGVRLRLFICEYADNALANGRKQAEYNHEIDGCDIFVILAGRRLGAYTLEEYVYAQAMRQQRSDGLPRILALRRTGDSGADAGEASDGDADAGDASNGGDASNASLRAFMDLLADDGHTSRTFSTDAELKTAMAEAIAGLLDTEIPFSLGDGRVWVAGKVIARL